MRDIRTKTGARCFVFESSHEAMEYTDKELFSSERADFTGRADLKSHEDLIKATQSNWQDGIVTLLKFVRKLQELPIPQLKDRKRKQKFSEDEGDEVDPERMMTGQPFWKKTEREEQEGTPEVTITIDTSTPGYVNPKEILWRGAAAIALARLLEEKGYRTEIWMVMGSNLFEGKSYKVVTAVNLKKTSDPLDLSTLVSSVSGWYYRSACFTLFKTLARKHGEKLQYGYGMAYSPRVADIQSITTDENLIYSAGVFGFEAAAALMHAELAKIAEHKPSGE